MALDEKPTEGGNKPSLRQTVIEVTKAILKIAVGVLIRDATSELLDDLPDGLDELFNDIEVTEVEEDEA